MSFDNSYYKRGWREWGGINNLRAARVFFTHIVWRKKKHEENETVASSYFETPESKVRAGDTKNNNK